VKNWKRLILFVLLPIIFSGCCMYTFKGNVAPHLKTIAIPPFENQTAEFGLSEQLTEDLIDLFSSDNTLKVRSLSSADAVIRATIVRIDDRPSTISANETVEEYKVTINVRVKCEDLVLGKVIWEENISNFGIYPFQGGSSADRKSGIDEAIEKIVEDILNKTVSGW
jgi:Lipopolysaccharide-assembly